MAIIVDSGFRITSAGPADVKSVWATTASLYLPPTSSNNGYISASWRYRGMRVFCLDNQSEYQLIGGTSDSNWVRVTSGSYYLTSSYTLGIPLTSSYALQAITSSYLLNVSGTISALSASVATSASWAESASYAPNIGYPVVTWSHSSMSLDMSFNKEYIRLTHATSCSITVESQSVVSWSDDVDMVFRVAGAGYPAIITSSGVTVNNGGAATTLQQHNTFVLKRVSQDVWDLI